MCRITWQVQHQRCHSRPRLHPTAVRSHAPCCHVTEGKFCIQEIVCGTQNATAASASIFVVLLRTRVRIRGKLWTHCHNLGFEKRGSLIKPIHHGEASTYHSGTDTLATTTTTTSTTPRTTTTTPTTIRLKGTKTTTRRPPDTATTRRRNRLSQTRDTRDASR